MDNTDRKRFFNFEENLNPIEGYNERNIDWFKENILPDFLKQKEQLKLGPSLLDVGCAFGYFDKILATHFDKVVAIDYAEERLKGAKEHNLADNITYLQVDLVNRGELINKIQENKMPDIIDSAYSSAVIQHIAPPERVLAFQNVWNVLKPNGYFVMYDETYDARPYDWDGFYTPLSPTWMKENISDLFTLESHDFVAKGLSGEHLLRYILRKKQ